MLSKSQIDRLGERLRSGSPTDQDLRELDAFRLSFTPAYTQVIRVLESMNEAPSGRPANSTPSIVDKLRRESIRLSQIQDIAGCRVIVESARRQRELTDCLNRSGVDHEVVILGADDEVAWRRTHGRYFPGGVELLGPDSFRSS